MPGAAVAERRALQLAEGPGLDSDARERLGLAVREAVANAVIHGNRLDPDLSVRLLLDRGAQRITVTVSDEVRLRRLIHQDLRR